MTTVYLNGNYIDRDQAKVSVLDRGFLFADGVYEVIPIYQGKLLRANEHLQRLQNSLAAIELSCPLNNNDWHAIFKQLLAQYPHPGDYQIYLQITRGAAKERTHILPIPAISPTIYVQITPSKTLSAKQLQQGLSVITAPDIRWQYCFIKSISLLPNILILQHARQQGADEAILIANGHVTEATASNVFCVKNNLIKTPAKQKNILGGITRDLTIEVAKQHHIPCEETTVTEQDLNDADEIWLTSSNKDIAPVTQLNGTPINGGKIGPMWHVMSKHFERYKRSLL
ncbi:MAG: aminotransferase class IV [Gammaproteobacteria bacterium]|nr:aminotransferase class IV [Gammaproteobacteria bacterium]